ncbi:MAG: glycosyltransferase family 4 protein [Victivallales bacterium]|nr:glycosyltransferase family 4 protein [Victivallales bacterium]
MPTALFCDASSIKLPMTGVQLAVLEQVHALSSVLPSYIQSHFFVHKNTWHHLPVSNQTIDIADCPSNPLPRIIWQQFRLPNILKKRQADLLYALAYTAPYDCPVPYILNVHDIIALENPELCSWRNLLQMKVLLCHSIRHAKKCVVSTNHGADALMRVLNIPSERIVVNPLGVDNQFFSRPSPRIHPRPYILFVGNIEPKKSLDTLLDAYSETADDLKVDLVIVGRAAWKSQKTVERLKHWKGQGIVHWMNYVPREQLPGIYQHAEVLIMPSITEGFGLPVLEAMAAGTPVIHSNHPALCEAAGKAGLAFAIKNTEELSMQLRRMLRSETLRQELIDAGRRHAAQRSWQRWGIQAAQLIEDI